MDINYVYNLASNISVSYYYYSITEWLQSSIKTIKTETCSVHHRKLGHIPTSYAIKQQTTELASNLSKEMCARDNYLESMLLYSNKLCHNPATDTWPFSSHVLVLYFLMPHTSLLQTKKNSANARLSSMWRQAEWNEFILYYFIERLEWINVIR